MGRRLHGDVPMTNRLGNPRSVWRRLLLDGGTFFKGPYRCEKGVHRVRDLMCQFQGRGCVGYGSQRSRGRSGYAMSWKANAPIREEGATHWEGWGLLLQLSSLPTPYLPRSPSQPCILIETRPRCMRTLLRYQGPMHSQRKPLPQLHRRGRVSEWAVAK